MQSELKQLEEKQKEFQLLINKVYIVNAGRMNHGKSSLLNSILGRDVFKVADVRETKVNQTETYMPNVYVVDTPGLGANIKDDDEAFEVYKQANFIMFVHSPNSGELHSQEIDDIRRISQELTPDFFWHHFAMILTFSEAIEEKSLQLIQQNIMMIIQKEFQIQDFPIFHVSNSRYKKGMEQTDLKRKQMFLNQSGILELREFIQQNISVWKKENIALQESRFNSLKKEVIQRLEKKEQQIRLNQENKKLTFDKKQNLVIEKCQAAIANVDSYTKQLQQEKASLEALNRKHRNERF